MTGKTFLNRIANGKKDIISILLNLLQELNCTYCVIDGLGVNAYAEPVVSLDLDIVLIADRVVDFRAAVSSSGMKVEEFKHSINISTAESDLRIQIQTDQRYQDFLFRSELKQVLGYTMSVASLSDLLKGKVWVYSDETRRKSKRQKDLSDIMRLVETYPFLYEQLPPSIQSYLD